MEFEHLSFGQDGYNLTGNGRQSIPESFRFTPIGNIYVELLRMDSSDTPAHLRNQYKNHAIIKVDFAYRYGNSKRDGYEGVRINIQTSHVISDEPYQPGELFVKPARYRTVSNNTARTCRIDFKVGITLDHLLWVIEKNNLQFFSFVALNNKYYGCRDFVTQFLYQLYLEGFTTGAILETWPRDPGLPPEANNICKAIGYRYMSDPVGASYVSRIEKGYFSHYHRIETPDMAYEG